MNVKGYLEEYLKENGFDGLFNADHECGCCIGDLFPCDEYFGECEPGYKVLDPTGEADWLIQGEKP
jgi:hypothetical protein